MKKFNYRKTVAVLLTFTSIASGMSFSSITTEAKKVSSSVVLKAPAVKRVKVKKRTYYYNKKGKKLKKKILKKGKKLKVVKKAKKIKGKKFYLVTKNRFVLVKDVANIKSKIKKPQKQPVNQSTQTNPGNSTNPVDTDTPANSANTGTTQPTQNNSTIADFSISEFRQEFLKELNNERTKRGLSPVAEDSHLDEVVQERTKLLPDNFAHVDANGRFILNDFFDKAGISRNSTSECLAMFPWGWTMDHSSNQLVEAQHGGTSALVADNMVYEYIYDDAASNWGHRDILLNPKDKTIGLGAVVDNNSDQIYSSVGVTY
ncbi:MULTISPECIES: SLAP domain-containing protein [Lactobacillus]|uniref:SLAP domain-containing protein n=1 Tax=Lactobacillus TaxID=1578 RepID=UPI0018DB28CA|nr:MULTISPECIES: SLAP domain-containing protein [Lactobacillus]MBI0033322.1 SLAP domain-containing protein [Lactobacillus sp. M0396]